MGVATTPAPKGLGPQNPTKKLAHVRVLLVHLLSQNRVPKLSDPGTPLSEASNIINSSFDDYYLLEKIHFFEEFKNLWHRYSFSNDIIK